MTSAKGHIANRFISPRRSCAARPELLRKPGLLSPAFRLRSMRATTARQSELIEVKMLPRPPADVPGLRRLSAQIRLNATHMVAIQGFGYLGQALSSAEIFAVLLGGGVMRFGHDRLVIS